MPARCIVLIPIYRNALEPLEQFSLDFSVGKIANHETRFLAPETLDVGYYTRRYPGIAVQRFPDLSIDWSFMSAV